jgi:hypothetical protein
MAEIRKGKKVDPNKLDRTKMGVSQVSPPRGEEVEAQARYWATVQCPCWGCVTWAYVDDTYYEWFTCGNCGCAFMP